MKLSLSACYASLVALALCSLLVSGPAGPQAKPVLTTDDIAKMMTSLSNWGRWGAQDQMGTINLITPEKRRQAAALVKDGVSVSLSHNVIKEQTFGSRPFEQKMIMTGVSEKSGASMDLYSVAYHGYSQTHLDSLCHIFYKGKMYNGFSQQEVNDAGAGKNAVINFKNGIFTRGVLIDIPRLLGEKYLKGAQPIYPEDIEAWEKKAGLKVRAGDAVFVRTGRWARWAAEGPWDVSKAAPGLHASCLPWLHARDVAILGGDIGSDVLPSGVEGVNLPVHVVGIVGMGMPLFDNCDLEALAEAAAARNRWEFLLTASPLAVDGGTGSPINPVAVF